MASDQERQQAVDALLVRLREETESAVRGFVNDVVTRADADRQRALAEARHAADSAVQTAVNAARRDVRAELDDDFAARVRAAEADHSARVAELEAKLAEARERAAVEQAAAVADVRAEADAERTKALAEAREQAAAGQTAAVADVRAKADAERTKALAEARKQADAEQAAALAQVLEQADTERVAALAESRDKADAAQAGAVADIRREAVAEQAAALSRARKEAASEQAEALSRVRKAAAVAQTEAVARAQETAVQAALAANAAGGVAYGSAGAAPAATAAAASDEEVRLSLDYGYPAAAGGEAAEDAARVPQLLDTIRHLDEQTTLTSLLEALTDAAAGYASRAALFVRVDGEMRAWRLTGFEAGAEEGGSQALNGGGSGFLGRAIEEGRALVLTPPPGEDELDWPPAFAALPSDRSAIAVPVSIGGQPMAALYADDAQREGPSTPAVWSDAIELLARYAGCSIEALTANHAAGLARR